MVNEQKESDFKSKEFIEAYKKTADKLGGSVVIEKNGFPSIVLCVEEEPSPWEV